MKEDQKAEVEKIAKRFNVGVDFVEAGLEARYAPTMRAKLEAFNKERKLIVQDSAAIQKQHDQGRLTAREFMNRMMGDEIGKGSFGFEEVGLGTDERAEFIFRRCPLEEGWKEMGLTAQERHRLCSIAREHDFGLVENKANHDLKLEMPESIGLGNPVCRIILSKKD